jgi:hypothetical protein
MTAMQEQTPADYQARITGLMESLGAAMPGVGYLLGGVIVTVAEPRAAFAVAGGGLLVLVAALFPLRARLSGEDPPTFNGANGHGTRGPREPVPTVRVAEAGPPEHRYRRRP